ncbi:MAG: preprotein translocase subunit SecY [Myxococcales bacterium]|nr:preprotein translocase subunit SecY [Polyangiaceae bacterium]MDW8249390.1 preprotein translocase subunit SecY [Myxococcales bacterium]
MVLANLAKVPRIPELRRRLLFTLAMLAVYRIGVFITTPGVNRNAMKSVVASKGSGLIGMFNLFSGGAVENLSIFALGIMPYISMSIIMSLLGMVYKPIEELRKEGEQGRRKLDQYTRMGTVVLAAFQAFGVATTLEGMTGELGEVVGKPGLSFRLMTILTLTTGTAFLMWVGEQITERGISNGTSLLIFAGIITDIPNAIGNYLQQNKGNVQPLTVATVALVIAVTVGTIAFFERAQRRIPIVTSRRQVGKRIYGGQQAHLPLKVNVAGTIPPIFASSLLAFPATLAQFKVPGMNAVQDFINRGDWVFNTFYTLLIIFFCFFYTAVTFQAVDVADNLKKQQANIPGIRPGKQTAEYIDRVLTRITFGGALYVAAVCVIPQIIFNALRVPSLARFGGTSIMIVVGVALETVNQIDVQLTTNKYEDIGTGATPKLSGRRQVTV